MGRKAFTYLALFVLLAILGYLVYQRVEDRRVEVAARQQAELRYAEVLRDEANEKKLPHPDRGLEWLPAAYPRPPSAWRASEKARYQAILGKGRFDILVVPFQVEDYAFGRDIRSFMTAQLAMAIGEAGKATVADPYLVAKALGDGERLLSLSDIFRLANAVGAKRIVAGYVGHELNNLMRVTLHLYERSEREQFEEYAFGPRQAKYGARKVASERLKSQHFEKIAYLESTPMDAFQATLPEMIKFLGMDPAALASAKPQSRIDDAALPKSPLALLAETAEPARDAYFLQLIAMLTSRTGARERERLMEKSLLALARMSPESPDYRLLKARALMHMGLRPAALRVLGTPNTAEEKHLLAVLNGNLTEVRANRAAVPAGARALMALLEQTAIEGAYGVYDAKATAAQMAALKLPGETWVYLARRALAEKDWWAQYDNLEFKALLDRELPVEGFTVETMLGGGATVGDMAKLRTTVDLSVLEHVRKRVERTAAQGCCQPFAARLTESDFLDLVEGVGTDNLARRAQFFIHTQGSPASGMEFLAKIEAAYKDHPDFVLERGYAEIALAASASGPEKDGLLKAAFVDGFNAWYWEQGQTRIAAQAESYVVRRSHREDFGPHPGDPYTYDYPMRTYYPYWDNDERLVRIALDNSCFDLRPATRLAWRLGNEQNKWDQVDELVKSLEGRFNGNPERIKLTAGVLARKGDYKALEQQYAEGIRLQPTAEELYTELGKLLFRNGETDRAAKVFMSFPGLRDLKTKPVELSNYVYEAGSLYYWSGDFKRALPFYKIAADLETGSASSIASATRIALLNGDYATALRGSVARAQRYKSPHAYRDYLGLLHAMAYSKEAWDGFDTLIQQIDKPQLWETALVGHQMEGRSEAEIAAWAAKEPIKSAGRRDPYAALYMLRAGVTDRKPTAQLPARIAALDRSGWKVGESERVFGPPPRGSYLPRKSRLLYYAEGYAAMRAGKFAEASAGLRTASTLYGISDSESSILPLYAYVATRAGDTASLEKALESFPPEEQGFDYQLAKGIIAGLAGKRDASLEHLKLALVRRPFTEYRPIFTEYQYAEVCEWLYEATRDARYRNLALDWAKRNEVVNPWFAWPYAVEARFSTNPAERARAMAMAYYLDRRSERLGMLPKTEVQNAVKEYANRNPFRRATDRTPKQPA